MNGWRRLWIFLSIIWVAVVASISAVIIGDIRVADFTESWVINRLSDESKQFYENLDSGESGPKYTLTADLVDGTKLEINIPLQTEIRDAEVRKKLIGHAKNVGSEITDNEILKFISKMREKNSTALKAKTEYENEINMVHSEKVEERWSAIKISVLAAVSIPLISYLLGYGVAWVRSGFKENA